MTTDLTTLRKQAEEAQAALHGAVAQEFAKNVRGVLPDAKYVQYEVTREPGYQDPDYFAWHILGFYDATGLLCRFPQGEEDSLEDERSTLQDLDGYENAEVGTYVWDLDTGAHADDPNGPVFREGVTQTQALDRAIDFLSSRAGEAEVVEVLRQIRSDL